MTSKHTEKCSLRRSRMHDGGTMEHRMRAGMKFSETDRATVPAWIAGIAGMNIVERR